MNYTQLDLERAIELLKYVKKGDLIFTIAREVTKTSMTIELVKLMGKGKLIRPVYLGKATAVVLNRPYNNGIKTAIGGMDQGEALVYALSQKLFNSGYALDHMWM